MTPEEKQKRIAELEARLAQLEPPAQPEEPGILEKAGRALNYVGGAGRAAVAGLAEPIIGKDLISMEQVASGTVPSTGELLKKAGVPEGPKVSEVSKYMAMANPLLAGPSMLYESGLLQKGGTFDPSLRDYAGIAGDVVLDPSTWVLPEVKAVKAVSPAGKAVVKLGEILLNPIGEAVSATGTGLVKGGKALYKSAFEKADRALQTRYGKGSIADILKSRGFKGSAEDALNKAQEINKDLGQKIGSYRQQADITGIMERPSNFDLAEKVVEKYRTASDPKMMAIADNLQEVLDSYKSMPPKTATELATVKRVNLDMAGGDTAFDILKSSPDRAEAELRRALGKSLAEAEDSAMKKALSPEEYKQYLNTKKEYGVTTKFGQKELNKLARAEFNRTGVAPSAVDVMGWGASMASGQPIAMGAMAAKKARDILRLTGTKTRLGPAMEALGGGIEATAAKVPPQVWLEMLRGKPEGEQQ